VRREDVLIVPLYNNLYLVHIEQHERRLVLYSVGVQARPLELKLFIQSRSEEPFQLRLAVGVVDNVLLLHDLEGQTSMMYPLIRVITITVRPAVDWLSFACVLRYHHHDITVRPAVDWLSFACVLRYHHHDITIRPAVDWLSFACCVWRYRY
jgi:hypothetical protein